jgi:hypothetical protein
MGSRIKTDDHDFEDIELSGAEFLPIIVAPEALEIVKKLIKDGVEGANDAFILYLCILIGTLLMLLRS